MVAILNQKWPPKYKNLPIWAKFDFQMLKVKYLELNPFSGHYGYKSHNFNVIPEKIKALVPVSESNVVAYSNSSISFSGGFPTDFLSKSAQFAYFLPYSTKSENPICTIDQVKCV